MTLRGLIKCYWNKPATSEHFVIDEDHNQIYINEQPLLIEPLQILPPIWNNSY